MISVSLKPAGGGKSPVASKYYLLVLVSSRLPTLDRSLATVSVTGQLLVLRASGESKGLINLLSREHRAGRSRDAPARADEGGLSFGLSVVRCRHVSLRRARGKAWRGAPSRFPGSQEPGSY